MSPVDLDALTPDAVRSGVLAGVPVTVHAGIGYDIIHEHPNCDGAALGAAMAAPALLMRICGGPNRSAARTKAAEACSGRAMSIAIA